MIEFFAVNIVVLLLAMVVAAFYDSTRVSYKHKAPSHAAIYFIFAVSIFMSWLQLCVATSWQARITMIVTTEYLNIVLSNVLFYASTAYMLYIGVLHEVSNERCVYVPSVGDKAISIPVIGHPVFRWLAFCGCFAFYVVKTVPYISADSLALYLFVCVSTYLCLTILSVIIHNK